MTSYRLFSSVSGPLSAFSDQSGTQPAPFAMPQGVSGVSGTGGSDDFY